MNLGKPGWLSALLTEAVQAHRPTPPQTGATSRAAQTREFLRRNLRETGLVYGTPTDVASLPQTSTAPEELLFLAVLRTFARLALEVADRVGAREARREVQLLGLFAALTGQLEDATEILAKLTDPQAPTKKQWARVENALAERSISLSGDPVYGLVLHNGAVYVDAQVFGRLASEYFRRGQLPARLARRLIDVAAREKVVLVEVLTALACAERPPSYPARRAILRQIEDLKLPSEYASELKSEAKRAFERRPKLHEVVQSVRSAEVKRFILEQTLLASLVDGRRSPEELAFIQQLARALGISDEDRARYELAVAEFYAQNRSLVDVFTVSAGAGVMGEELVDSAQRTLEKNFHALLKEVRETGELSVLLAKAARGQSLTDDERKKVKEQLIDVAKAIPALAIFAAPGGVLLLMALAKVLPFNILPSSFQDEEPTKE
jgi:hypothetical protein